VNSSTYVIQILFEVSNNEAKYEALLHGLCLAVSLGIKRLLVYDDSLLVVQQVNKEWDINKDTMDAYITEVCKLENKFSGLKIHHVVWDNNVGADVLSKLGSNRANVPPGVFVHEIHHPSIKAPDQSTIAPCSFEPDREVMMIEVDRWVPFIDFIKDQKLPPGVDEKCAWAARIIRQSKGYVLVSDKLYKHGSAIGILMKCVPVDEVKEIQQEIQEGIYGNHAASRTQVKKAFANVEDLVHRCTNWQFFGR
jgi:hypothetical protein